MAKQLSSPDKDIDRVFKTLSLSETSYNGDLIDKMLDWITNEGDFDKSKYFSRLVSYAQSSVINEIVRLMNKSDLKVSQWQIAGVVLGERFVDEEDSDYAYVHEKESPSKVIKEIKYDEQGSDSELFKYEYIADNYTSAIGTFNGAVLYPIGANQYVKVLYQWAE